MPPFIRIRQSRSPFHSGGLEMLFSNQRKHKISIPARRHDGQPANLAYLITWLCDNLMKDPRRDMFVLDDSVYVLLIMRDRC